MEQFHTKKEGPPCKCTVMVLKAASNETTPPDLSLPVTLTGVREPNNKCPELKFDIKRQREGIVVFFSNDLSVYWGEPEQA